MNVILGNRIYALSNKLKFNRTFCLNAVKNQDIANVSTDASESNSDISTDSQLDNFTDCKADISGLRENHRKIMHKKMPKLTKEELEVMPLSKYRRLYGSYGEESGVDMKALWPSHREMELMKEREQLEFPNSLQKMIQIAKEEKIAKEKEIMDRQNEIRENMKKLGDWKAAVRMLVQKKEDSTRIALEKKQKQIEEVQAIVGYELSPFDPKFQEILDKKMVEDKKKAKKERKLRQQQLVLDKLMAEAKMEAEKGAESEKKKSVEGGENVKSGEK